MASNLDVWEAETSQDGTSNFNSELNVPKLTGQGHKQALTISDDEPLKVVEKVEQQKVEQEKVEGNGRENGKKNYSGALELLGCFRDLVTRLLFTKEISSAKLSCSLWQDKSDNFNFSHHQFRESVGLAVRVFTSLKCVQMCPNVFSKSAFYVLSKQLPASCFFSSSNRCGRKRELLATWASHSASWKLKVPKSIWRHPKECQRISRGLSPTISRRNLVQYRLNHVKFTSPVVHCSGKLLTANFCHWNPLEMPSASVSSEDGFWVRRWCFPTSSVARRKGWMSWLF